VINQKLRVVATVQLLLPGPNICAKHVGVATTVVSAWETNRCTPSLPGSFAAVVLVVRTVFGEHDLRLLLYGHTLAIQIFRELPQPADNTPCIGGFTVEVLGAAGSIVALAVGDGQCRLTEFSRSPPAIESRFRIRGQIVHGCYP